MKFPLQLLSPLMGSRFSVHTEVGEVPLVLSEAYELPRRGLPEEFTSPISLIFEGPADVVLKQDNYMIEHPALGKHLWSIAPVMRQPVTAKSAVREPAMHTPQYEVMFV